MFSARLYLPGQAKEGSHMHTDNVLYTWSNDIGKMAMERKQRLTDN